MRIPEIPANEHSRLEALRELKILDTLPEEEFDNVTKLASEICQVPISLITLVDEKRQWFKSHHGLDVEYTSRDVAYCAHAINNPAEILEVPDASEDERFHDNPLAIGEPYVRFYAGVPLVDPEGHALGTLCVIDHKPNQLSVGQREALKTLAQHVMAILNVRSKNVELLKSQQKFQDLVNHMDDMIYELDSKGCFKFSNIKLQQLSGYSAEELAEMNYLKLVKESTRSAMIAFYDQQRKNKQPKSYYEFPMITRRGEERMIGQNVVIDFDEQGKLIRVMAVARDVTELNEQQRVFRLLSENSKDLICLHEPDATYIYVSSSVKELLGFDQQEMVGKNPYDFMHPEDAERLKENPHIQTIKGKEVGGVQYRMRTSAGNYLWLESYTKPIIVDGEVVSFQTSSRDISKRKFNELQVQKSKENIEALIENTEDAIWSVDRKLRYKIANGTYKALIKWLVGREPQIGESGLDVGDKMFQDLLQHYMKSLDGKKFNVEYQLTHNGVRRYFQKFFNPIKNEEGAITGVSVFARDISHEKKILSNAEGYREGLQLLNIIFSNTSLTMDQQIGEALKISCEYLKMPSGIISHVEGDHVSVRKYYSVEPVPIKEGDKFPFENTFSQLIYDHGKTIAVENVGQSEFNEVSTFKAFNVQSFIGTSISVNGTLYGTISFGSTQQRAEFFDSNETDFVNILAGWIGFNIEKQLYERRLRSEQDVLRAFVLSAPAAIAMLDENLTYLAVSSQWKADYHLGDRDLIGLHHYEVFPKIPDTWKRAYEAGLQGKESRKERELFEMEDGQSRWLRWEVRPWYASNKEIGGIIVFTEDITRQITQEEELKLAKNEAEKASQAKEFFLSSMSHEIRTPMNAIIGISNIMLYENPRPDQLENLKLLKFSSSNLLVLINDILDFNKIEAGKMELELIDFNLKEVAMNVYQTMLIRTNEKGLVFLLDYQNGLPENFVGDPVRITQILTNLLGNAIKFTEEGMVKFEIVEKERVGKEIVLCFTITDTGIGIPGDKIDTIFENFTQASTNVARKFGGTGLGLAITRELLKIMGSDVSVESEVDNGSVFTFDLKLPIGSLKSLKQDYSEVGAVPSPDSNTGIKLLVAEDHKTNREILAKFLDRWGFKYDFAVNGLEALQMAGKKDYSMILMDIQMPIMDGFEATREIRKLNNAHLKAIPIYALTASVLLGVQEKALSAGMNGYISKPFDPDELYSKIVGESIRYDQADSAIIREVISQEAIAQMSLGDEDFKRELFIYYSVEFLRLLSDLRFALEGGDHHMREARVEALTKLNTGGIIPDLTPLLRQLRGDISPVDFSRLSDLLGGLIEALTHVGIQET
ncbi:PAS domain S-box protein [Marinoscillum sp.]|uniref:PAS domain S-box protein n=1 Tax=Marinoscillum sp. TaxID=2024838 RepID=UPI003BADB2F1